MRVRPRTIGAAALAGVGLGLLIAVALALASLHTFVSSHRDRLVARVERLIGRPLTVGEVRPSWWPFGVCLADVAVAEDAAFGGAPFLRMPALRVAVRPSSLLAGRVEVARVILEQPDVRL